LASPASGFDYRPAFITPAEERALLLRFRPYPPARTGKREILSLELEPGSAYALRNAVRWKWQHSIAPTTALRYSITFRTLASP
jgi:hypothetical protein